MTASNELLSAYRFHRQALHATRLPAGTPAGLGAARIAVIKARLDVAANVKRYPHTGPIFGAVAWDADKPGLAYVQSTDGAGLRLVGNVESESHGSRDCWSKRDGCGWYTDPHGDSFKDGTGLCWGVVYQLTARNGAARFVPGYQLGGTDSGPTLDFGCVQSSSTLDGETNARDLPAAREAARVADRMAQMAAEAECEYQTAWQAGSQWAQLGETIVSVRNRVVTTIQQFKRARKVMTGRGDSGTYDQLCTMIRRDVADLIEEIRQARAQRATLRAGNDTSGHASIYWFTGDKRLREAFNEGAGHNVLAV